MFRGWLDSFSLVASMLGFACQIVRGFSAFVPCLEHVCAGGGGSVANAGLMIHDGIGKYVLSSNHSVLVLSDRCQFGCHGEACERMGRT